MSVPITTHVPENTSDEQQLLLRAQGGDERALGELLRKHRPAVLGFVRRSMSHELAAQVDVEDIVQEVVLEAVSHLDAVDDVRRLAGFLRRIAARRVIDSARFHRRARRDAGRRVPLDVPRGDGHAAGELMAPCGTPSSVVSRAEQHRHILAGISKLTPDHREVIRLRDLEQLGWPEIRDRMQRGSIDAVRMLYQRAVVQLRRQLGLGG
ncbi:MAG: sigma-70 family RNA polymerase sigma factor [Planctomycetes bacterium]|nr:sigma-70 family RNA polymerase sigma factor [Planctomycetota bacterium]